MEAFANCSSLNKLELKKDFIVAKDGLKNVNLEPK